MKKTKAPPAPEACYWEESWHEAEFLPGAVWEHGSRRQIAQTRINTKNHLGSLTGAYYQHPLSRTILDPELYIKLEASIDECRARFNWMPASIRSYCNNRVAVFIRHYSTPEGRLHLMSKGLQLFDDDGSLVDSRGHLLDYRNDPSGLNSRLVWKGDTSQAAVEMKCVPLLGNAKSKSSAAISVKELFDAG